MVSENLLIGETVSFLDGYQQKKGLVMGTEVIKFTPYDVFPTTAYIIQTESGELKHIPYHKVIAIIEPDIAFLELLVKEGDLIQINYPKYEKPDHPKGWSVDRESNNDLPI